MYLNIGRESGLSCTDTDDEFRLTTKDAPEYSNTDNVYCNAVPEDIPNATIIKVEELGDYIKKRGINEGLGNEYKVNILFNKEILFHIFFKFHDLFSVFVKKKRLRYFGFFGFFLHNSDKYLFLKLLQNIILF